MCNICARHNAAVVDCIVLQANVAHSQTHTGNEYLLADLHMFSFVCSSSLCLCCGACSGNKKGKLKSNRRHATAAWQMASSNFPVARTAAAATPCHLAPSHLLFSFLPFCFRRCFYATTPAALASLDFLTMNEFTSASASTSALQLRTPSFTRLGSSCARVAAILQMHLLHQ